MINKELQKRILSSLILIPVSLFFIIKGSIFFIFFLSACFLIASYEWYNLSKNKILNKITFKNFVNNLFGAYAS